MQKYTKFESELIDLVVWLLQGRKNGLTDRATNRILRATLRRIKPDVINESISSKTSTETVVDHAIPLKIVVEKLCEVEALRENIVSILDQLLVMVKITKHEHTKVLREAGLDEGMPLGWDGKDLFARYKQAGIEIEPISPIPVSKS